MHSSDNRPSRPRQRRVGTPTPTTSGRSGLTTVFLSLGSNLGDRQRNLTEATERLAQAGMNITASSPIYETAAVEVAEQPHFLNQVIQAETSLSPLVLLRLVKQIELAMGRPLLTLGKPRKIDIDILLYDDIRVVAADLVIPHPRMWQRKFVLLPLLDLGLDPVAPSGEKASQLLKKPEIVRQSAVCR